MTVAYRTDYESTPLHLATKTCDYIAACSPFDFCRRCLFLDGNHSNCGRIARQDFPKDLHRVR